MVVEVLNVRDSRLFFALSVAFVFEHNHSLIDERTEMERFCRKYLFRVTALHEPAERYG